MKKKRFTEEQISYTLRRAENGTPVAEGCRNLGISEQTFYRWKRKYVGMGVAELHRLKQLEQENKKLKQLDENTDDAVCHDTLSVLLLIPSPQNPTLQELINADSDASPSRRAPTQSRAGGLSVEGLIRDLRSRRDI